MPKSFEEVLEICIDEINKKSVTIEECLNEFPQFQQELKEMLPIAVELKSLRQIKPSPEFSWKATNRLASKLPNSPVTFRESIRLKYKKAANLHNHRLSMPNVIVTLLIVVSMLVGGSYAVEAAGPGDLLYGLDQSIEQIRLSITSNPEKATALRMQNATERLQEAEKKLENGDVENATKALKAYNKAMSELVGNEEAPVHEEIRTMSQEESALQAGTLDRISLSQPEEAKAQCAFQNEFRKANMGIESLFGPPEGIPHVPFKEIPEDPECSEDTKGFSTQEAPKGPTESPQKGPGKNRP